MRRFALLGCLLLASCASAPSATDLAAARKADEAQLLALHQSGLRAHLAQSIDSLLVNEADDFVLVNRGTVSSPPKADRKSVLGPYLEATKFEYYRDKVPPVVKVSADGSLGWVACQVEAKGVQQVAPGKTQPLEFVAAWVSLYEKRDGRWLAIGNSSSFAGS